MRVAVIGAGPMGIAAALAALERGHDVTLLERDAIGASLRSWGGTRFFSPFRMNVSRRMRELLGTAAPEDDALLTGGEYVERVLIPLAASGELRERIHTGRKVIGIGRRGLTRGDFAGHPLRAERPFRIVCDDDEVFEADAVLDASGGFTIPRPVGHGGLPVPGERTLVRPPIRTLGALEGAAGALRGKRVLLIGDGHSAANAMAMLPALAVDAPDTRIIWAVRSPNRRPCEEVSNDPLPERLAVVSRANDLAATPPAFLRVERRAMVERFRQNGDDVTVTLSGGRTFDVDAIAAFTGFRPDSGFLSELEVEISPVTEGGARLYRAISSVTDCLSVPAVSSADLASGEPNYFFVGSRAYGRANSFLLATGFAQLEVIVNLLGPGEVPARENAATGGAKLAARGAR